MNTKYSFTIIVEKDTDGYSAYCPQLQGCYAQGDTYEEVLTNMKDVIELYIEDRKFEKETWKMPESINITSLEFSI